MEDLKLQLIQRGAPSVYACEGGKTKKFLFSYIPERDDAPGTLSMGECRKRALEEVGYDLVKCKHCNGTGIQKD